MIFENLCDLVQL